MAALLAKLGKWIANIPVLFVRLPGPTIMLTIITMIISAAGASWTTHKLEAGARADLKADVARCEAQHAGAVATAATERASIIDGAAKRQAEIDAQNREVFLAMLRVLTDTTKDDAAIAALAKSIEELH